MAMVDIKPSRKVQPTVMDVWHWDEFQKFAKRLGVDTSMSTSLLRITMTSPESPVLVELTFQAEDKSQGSKDWMGIDVPDVGEVSVDNLIETGNKV